MNASAWLGETFALRLALTLLHFVWQGVAVASIVVVVGWLLKRAAAQVRYAVNVAAMFVMVACLLVTFATVDVAGWVSRPDADDSGEPSDEERTLLALRFAESENAAGTVRVPSLDLTEAEVLDEANVLAGGSGDEPATLDKANSHGASRETSELNPRHSNYAEAQTSRVLAWIGPVSPYLTVMYVAGVAVMLLRLARSLLGGQRLRGSATPVEDEDLLAMIARQARHIGLRAAPTVAYCDRILVPVVIGLVKPMILLPAALASGLSPDQLQALVTHELAHIRRFDLLVNLLQRLIEAVLFFHPAVWFVSRRVSIERENAADDMVLAAGSHRASYADALVRMAELSLALRNTRISNQAAALAASGNNTSDFKRRVLRLLENTDVPKLRLTRGGILAMVMVAASLLVTPVLVDTWAQPRSNPEEAKRAADEITPIGKLFKQLSTHQFLEHWKLRSVDERPSVVVDDYRGYRVVLRRTWKHYTDTGNQTAQKAAPSPSGESNRPFELRHEDWEFVLVAIQPNKAPATLKSRIKWQKSNSPYHTRDVCLGEGHGYVWFTRGTINLQDYVRGQLKLEGGDDRIQLVIDGLAVEDSGSNTSNSCQHMVEQFGDRALPYVERAIERSGDDNPWRIVGSLAYIRTQRATALLTKLAGSEDRDLRLAAYYALIHRPIRKSARQTYIEMLRRHRYVDQVCQACIEFKWREALPVLRDVIKQPRNLRELETAIRTRRILEGKPISEALLKADQTLRSLTRADREPETEKQIRAAYDLLVDSDDAEAANLAALSLALFVYKGSTAAVRAAGIEILVARPEESTMEFLTTLSVRLDRNDQIEEVIKAVIEARAALKPQVSWGETVNGLQAGISIAAYPHRVPGRQLRVGDYLFAQVTFRNVSSDPIQFTANPSLPVPVVTDQTGKQLQATIPPADGSKPDPFKTTHRLAPMKSVTLRCRRSTIAPHRPVYNSDGYHIVADAGKYSLTAPLSMSRVKGGDWTGTLQTGTLGLEVFPADASESKLGFLSDVPEFRELDLSVNEERLMQVVAKHKLVSRVTKTEKQTTYTLYNPKGECVVVMFRDGKCSGIQRLRPDPDFGGNWGEPLLGLRMRLTAPRGSEYRRGTRLPLLVEMQNVSDEPIQFADLAPSCDFKVFTEAGDWLGIARRGVAISPWERAAGSLTPQQVIQWHVWFDRMRLNKPAEAGSTVLVHVSVPRQIEEAGKLPRTSYSTPVMLKLIDAPMVALHNGGKGPELTAKDVSDRWTEKMDLVYREAGGLRISKARVIHIDGQGHVTMLDCGVADRTETKLDRDRLNKLAKRLHEMKVWELSDVDWRLANVDEGEVRISLTYGGAAIVGDYANGLMRNNKTLAAFQTEMLAVIDEAVKTSRKPPAEDIDRRKEEVPGTGENEKRDKNGKRDSPTSEAQSRGKPGDDAPSKRLAGEETMWRVTRFKPVWGPARDGVQVGIAITTDHRKFRSGERVLLEIYVRNVGEKTLGIKYSFYAPEEPPAVHDADGKRLRIDPVFLGGTIPLYRHTLKPNEVVAVHHQGLGLGDNPTPGKFWHPFAKDPVPGSYRLAQSVWIDVTQIDGVDGGPRLNLTSGEVALEIVDGEREDQRESPASEADDGENGEEKVPGTDDSSMYYPRHLYQDGQSLSFVVRKESLSKDVTARHRERDVPRVRVGDGLFPIFHTTTTTEMTFRVDEKQKDTQVVRAAVKGVQIVSFHGGDTREFTAKQDPNSKNFYDLHIGREFTFHITAGGKPKLTAGVDALSEAMKGHRLAGKNWQEALVLKLFQPSVYLPPKPVAVGDTWKINRTLGVVPTGYPVLHGFEGAKGALESVEAKLVAVKKSERGQIAHVALVGQVSQGSYRTFDLQGSLEVDLSENNLRKLHVTLTDQKASPAKLDPLYRYVIDVHPPARIAKRDSPESEDNSAEEDDEATVEPSNTLRVRLSDATWIDLAGVTAHPQPHGWWRADGTPMDEGLVSAFPESPTPRKGTGNMVREIRMQARIPSDATIKVLFSAGGLQRESRTELNEPPSKWSLCDYEFSHVLVDEPATLRVLKPFQVKVADGEWKTLASCAADGGEVNGIRFEPVAENDGRLSLKAWFGVNVRDVRFVVEDTEGQEHVSAEGHELKKEGVSYAFEASVVVPRKRIRMIHLQRRPFKWFEFRNVSLHPGKLTAASAKLVGITGDRDYKLEKKNGEEKAPATDGALQNARPAAKEPIDAGARIIVDYNIAGSEQ